MRVWGKLASGVAGMLGPPEQAFPVSLCTDVMARGDGVQSSRAKITKTSAGPTSTGGLLAAWPPVPSLLSMLHGHRSTSDSCSDLRTEGASVLLCDENGAVRLVVVGGIWGRETF